MAGPAAFEPAAVDVYFDIEGDPEHDVLYLFGVLVRERSGAETYRAFVAERPEEEERAFLELLAFLESLPDAPMYHYHHYERAALRQLGGATASIPGGSPPSSARLRDLHRDLVSSVVLPVYSYSLKAVAKSPGPAGGIPMPARRSRCTGIRRGSGRATGGTWTTRWGYNEDDCRATRVLKEWLEAGPGTEADVVAMPGAGAPRGPAAGGLGPAPE